MCKNDFYIPNHIQKLRKWREFRDIKIPCRRCIFCRIDKSEWYVDAGNYEHNKYGTATFATLTYDPINLVRAKRQRYLEDGEIRYTCSYEDGVKFVDRLRKHIKNKGQHSKALRQDFKYIMATEYGEQDNLPHIHIILFGIDNLVGHKLIEKKWSWGFVDVKPLLAGGIRYVAEYIMKAKFGDEAKEEFDRWGLEQPRVKHSKGYGQGLIEDNLSEIIKNNGKYVGHNGKLRPIPQYYKEKFNIRTGQNDTELKKKYKSNGIAYTKENIAIWEKKWAEISYKNAVEKMRQQGKGVLEEHKYEGWKIQELAEKALQEEWDDEIPF